jgi:peptidoglycan/LPS O-acetylase OafA/YrhL
MLPRVAILNRSTPLVLPLVSLVACVMTLVAHQVPIGTAITWPFASWIPIALLFEVAIGAALALTDIFYQKQRRSVAVIAAVLVIIALPFGWSTALGLLF